jgi:protein involved in polysaccharide export with SLBB domain
MKKVFLILRIALPGILLLCLNSEGTALAQDPKVPEKAANAFKTPDREKNQTETAQTGTQANHPEGPANPPRSGDNETVAQQFYESATNFYAAGKFDEAINAFLQSARLKPENAQTHYGLGMAYAKSKSYQEASDSFKRAVKFKPDWPEANFRVGMMAYVLGNKTQATDVYNKLKKLNSPLANTLYKVIREDGSTAAKPENSDGPAPTPADIVPASAVNTTTAVATAPKEEAKAPEEKPAAPPATPPATPIETARTVSLPARANPEPASANSAASAEPAPTAVYKVGVGDVLDIRLLNSTIPRSTLYTVMDGGLIDLPLAGGPLQVAGFTTDEIQGRLSAELKRRAVEVNAHVAVGVRQYSSHAVIVTGLVANPGTRFLRREAIPLYVLMAEVQPRLDAGRITILRPGVEARTFDLSDSAALSTLIQQGDVINVGPRPQEFYYIGGRVNYPGQKPFQAGITLLQAILAAGGPSQNESNIDLSRESADGRLTTFRVSLKDIKAGKQQDPKLRPGDRIEVVR